MDYSSYFNNYISYFLNQGYIKVLPMVSDSSNRDYALLDKENNIYLTEFNVCDNDMDYISCLVYVTRGYFQENNLIQTCKYRIQIGSGHINFYAKNSFFHCRKEVYTSKNHLHFMSILKKQAHLYLLPTSIQFILS